MIIVNNQVNEDELSVDEKCCEAPDIFITIEGNVVCRHCGTCFGTELVGQPRRAYSADEVKARQTTEPVWRRFGSRTVITSIKSDAHGRQLSAKKQLLFSRLSHIQSSLVSSIERNFWEAKPKLQALAEALGVPDYINETAWKIYSEAARQRLTMGRSIQAFVCASLYAAIRVHNFPRLLDEITALSIHTKLVPKSLALLIQRVLPKLKLKYRALSSRSLVFRFGEELRLPIGIQQAAVGILKQTSSIATRVGKDPRGLAAAALYIVAKRTNHQKTQTEIAEVFKITEVTLRTRAKQMHTALGKEWQCKFTRFA